MIQPLIPLWVSIVFIVLSVLTMSFAVLLIKKAILNSGLEDSQKVSHIRNVGLVGRIWIMLTAILGVMDYFADFSSFPPRILIAILPPLATVIWLTRTRLLKDLLPAFPILFVYYLQFFRVIVELELHQLWKAGLLPQSMTFEGRNFDILIGLSAPVVGCWSIERSNFLSRWRSIGTF